MRTRTWALAAAGVSAAALAATGITYTLTAGSTSASPSVQRAAQPVQQAAPVHPPVQSAPQQAQQAAPDAAASGGGSEHGEKHEGENGEKHEGRDHEDGGRGHDHEEAGRIYFNERSYSASEEGCITAASGLGSSSFSVFNDSRKIVEVFRGFSCDNGGPVATVGPYGATDGVAPRTGHGGVFGDNGAVGSFLVIGDRDEW
ncbi:hypothetical protein ACH4E7_35490 [Kitasatospora sp. NPDC018058]|uniref:hypothetical protein n=1 Tax=Kitasatospora sp. NPDC018058 TaxID=3364025 RepID=UPI0037BF0E28